MAIPRWALIGLLSLIALACCASLYVASRRFKTDRAARRLLEQGKLQITVSPQDIKKVADNIRNAN